MKQLTQRYRVLDRDIAMLHDRLGGERSFERTLFIPDEKSKKEVYEQLDDLCKRLDELEIPDEVYSIMKEQMHNFIGALKLRIKNMFERPYLYIGNIMYKYSDYAEKCPRIAEERADVLLAKFSCTGDLWKSIEAMLKNVSTLYIQEFISGIDNMQRTFNYELKRTEELFSGLEQEKMSVLNEELKAIISKSDLWKNTFQNELTLRGVVPQGQSSEEDIIKFEEDYYRNLLENELGVNLDEIISWHEEEVEKTRKEVFVIAHSLDIPDEKPTTMQEVNNILNRYAGAYDDPKELMRKAEEYLERARQATVKVMPLHDETCIVVPVPESIKYSYPWGAYSRGHSEARPLVGNYCVNEFNYSAVTDGWIKMMALHEAYPGHHVQFVRSVLDRLPEVIKIGARSVPITEGTAHRTERIFEYVFKEDQFYPLFVAYRRHHTSVRIKAELWLRYYGKPIKEVVDLYVSELGFDRKTARGQVLAQESMQGYFNCYYYGMKKIEDLERKFGFEVDEYTRYLFDAGRVSLEILERFLALSPEDKNRYTNDFASILQFGE